MTPVAELMRPLRRFSGHRTYPATVSSVERVLSTQGTEMAEQYVRRLVDHYEDLYLSRLVRSRHLR